VKKDAAALESPALRLALGIPVLTLLAFVVFHGGVAAPAVVAALLLVGVALAVVTLALASRSGVPGWWRVTATCVGVGLLPVLLVEGLAAPVDTFSLLFVLILVIGAFTYPDRMRTLIFVWTLGAWGVTLWWDGVRAIDLILLHIGAGALVAYTVSRTADALGRAFAGQAVSRQDAERRADLLARILEVHTLDREEVLQAVLEGLEDVGFAAVSVRVPEGDELVLAAGVGLDGDLEDRIPVEGTWPGMAVRSGRIERIRDRERMTALGIEAAAAEAIAVPIGSDDRPAAVVAAITLDGPVRPQQREAIELLSSLAGRALRRADVYAADRRTVVELQRLEAHTQDFLSTVSHELRTPLTVVQGLGRMLRTRWDDLDPERREDLVRRVDANAARLAQMVRSLLDTSAFEEGRMVPELQVVSLDILIEGLLHRLASVTAAHPVVVDVPDDVDVLADPALVAHVLENLLTNTAKHTPQGTRITLSAHPAGDDRVEVVVTDEGPGIPESDLPHVLDRFYRGGDPVSRPAGGLGLGLALASQILAAHDSELHVDSEEGHGARFSFQLQRPSVRTGRV
jgi:K+-sensing histidine kinase KdpD